MAKQTFNVTFRDPSKSYPSTLTIPTRATSSEEAVQIAVGRSQWLRLSPEFSEFVSADPK